MTLRIFGTVKALLTISALFFGEVVWGQSIDTAVPDTLDGYLHQALKANPQLQAVNARYEAAMAKIPQASSLPNPMFQVTHFVDRVQTKNGPQDNVFMLSQRVPWFGTLGKLKSVASAKAEALWYASEAAQLQLVTQVSTEYYKLAYLDKALELANENLELLNALEPVIDEKVRSGASVNGLLKLHVEIETLRDKIQGIQEQQFSTQERLRALLALDSGDDLRVSEMSADAISIPDGHSLSVSLEENNPKILSLRSQVRAGEVMQDLAELTYYPDLTVGLNYVQIGENSTNPSADESGKDAWGITVGFSIPLWRYKNASVVDQAKYDKLATEKELESNIYELKAKLSNTLSSLRDAERRKALYSDKLIPLARQAEENSRSGYSNGKNSFLDVIDSERSLLSLQLNYWKAVSDAHVAYVTLLTLVNQPIETFKN
jgi:outer membrane protein TolC